jgi:hypothetical protein
MNNALKKRKKIFIDSFMIIISIYFTFDYYNLILAGDVLIRRKIVLVVWIVAAIGWGIKLLYDLKNKNKYES